MDVHSPKNGINRYWSIPYLHRGLCGTREWTLITNRRRRGILSSVVGWSRECFCLSMQVLQTLDISVPDVPVCHLETDVEDRDKHLILPWMCPDLFGSLISIDISFHWQNCCQFERFHSYSGSHSQHCRCGSLHLRPAWFEARGPRRSLARWWIRRWNPGNHVGNIVYNILARLMSLGSPYTCGFDMYYQKHPKTLMI